MSWKRRCGRPAALRSPMCISPCLKTTAKSASAARTSTDATGRCEGCVAIVFRRQALLSSIPGSAHASRAALAAAGLGCRSLAANSGLVGHLATPAPTPWCFHADRLSRTQGQGHLAWQFPPIAVSIAQPISARHAVGAASQSVRGKSAPIRLQGYTCLVVEDGECPNHSMPTTMSSLATRPWADFIAHDAQWIGDLQRLDGRVHGVGHIALDAVHAVTLGSTALSAGDGFDVGVGTPVARVDTTNADQIHGALAGRWHALWCELGECPQHRV